MTQSPESRCCENVRRWFAETGGPEPVIVSAVRATELGLVAAPILPHRVYIEWGPDVHAHLAANSNPWKFGTGLPAHQPWGKHSAVGGGRERRVRWALQWILHQFGLLRLLEIDFDGSNPGWQFSVAGWLVAGWHLVADVAWQKVTGRSTDPFKVAAKRGWSGAVKV